MSLTSASVFNTTSSHNFPQLHYPFLAGTAEDQLWMSNQNLWIIILVFLVVLVSLIFAYISRDSAYNLVIRQKESLESLNTKLSDQAKQLEEANNAKDQLISVISHDLRAPLASLDGCLEIMLTEDLTEPEKDELIRDLQKDTYNTLKTLDDLLAWARLQQKGGKIEKSHFDISGLIKEVLSLYKPIAQHKEVTLDFQGEENSHFVMADANQIRTVVRNLLSNAIKFTPIGGRVKVSCNCLGNKVEVVIEDEGKGITIEDLLKIKDPANFYSSQGTAGENGTGVGLMLSFEFIDSHDSVLELLPAKPKGTKARFHLNSGDPQVAISS